MTIVDLIKRSKSLIVQNMNAAEIIEEIAQLPESEKGKVVEFVRHLPNAETLEAINEPTDDLPRYTSMDEVRSAIKGIVHHS